MSGLVLLDGGPVALRGEFGQVELADHRWDDVGGFQVVVVAWAVEVGGHHGKKLRAVLPVVGPAHLNPGDFGHGVGAVGGLQGAGVQIFLLDGLRTVARVDAGRAQEQQPLDTGAPRLVDDVGLDGEVFADEFRGIGVVGQYPAHFGGGEEDVFRSLGGEEGRGGRRCRSGR